MAASLHSWICMLEWLLCFTGFIYGVSSDSAWKPLWWVSLLCLLLVPIFNEIVLNLKAIACRSKVLTVAYQEKQNLKERLPIVYSPGYNITAFGIEKCHPFDSTKYLRVYDKLVQDGLINMTHRVH